MTMQKMNIPKTLRVGYREREGTYTGRLAYVTYIDEKGKHRKQKSWDGWRDHKIADDSFDNEPTEGFVLNKKVGGYRYSSWDQRATYCRVYDPRGFEFEITVENLLYILDYCSSIQGKGLEGEFIYAWDKADLVLLPVNTPDYKASTEFTSLQTKKVTRKDMVEGRVYLNKNNDLVMYLGRHEVTEKSYKFNNGVRKKVQHVFKYIVEKEDENKYGYSPSRYYWFQSGFTKLASIHSEDIDPDFANEYQKFIESKYHTMADHIEFFRRENESKYFSSRTSYFYKDDDGNMWHFETKFYGNLCTVHGMVRVTGDRMTYVNSPIPKEWVEKMNYEKNTYYANVPDNYTYLKHMLTSDPSRVFVSSLVNKFGNKCENYYFDTNNPYV